MSFMGFPAVSAALWIVAISSAVVVAVAVAAMVLTGVMERRDQRRHTAQAIQAVESHLAGQARDRVH